MIERLGSRAAIDLDGALGSLVRSQDTLVYTREAVMPVGLEDGGGSEGQLTQSVHDTTVRCCLSNDTRGIVGLGDMSELGVPHVRA